MTLLIGLTVLIGYHAIFIAIGFALGRRAERRARAAHATLVRGMPCSSDIQAAILREIDTPAFAAIVGPDERKRLRALYLGGAPAVPEATFRAPTVTRPAPLAEPTRAQLPPTSVPPEPLIGPPIPAPPPKRFAPTNLDPAPRRRRERVQLEPALVLLYLGAFLIVAAGLIYASFNWDELEGGQKLALLAAATVGFLAAGTALLRSEKLRPAAETFIGIGALLIPSNIIAAMTILSGTPLRATLALQLGAVLATTLYAFYSFRPGTMVYRYATVVAATIAIGVLPASLGADRAWALPVVAAAPTIILALLDRVGRRSRRFLRPTYRIGMVAGIPALLGIGPIALPEGREPLVLAGILAGWAITLGTISTVRRMKDAGYAAIALSFGATAVTFFWLDREIARMFLTTGFGLLAVALTLKGPRFHRTALGNGLGAAALAGFAMNVAAPSYGGLLDDIFDARALTWIGVLCWWIVPAGWALVATVRRWWPVLTPVSLLTFVASVITMTRLGWLDGDDWTGPLRLAPIMLVLALLPAWLRTHGPREDRRAQSRWLWIGFAILAMPMTAWVLDLIATEAAHARPLTIGYFGFFTIAAVVAAQQFHVRPAMVAATFWVIGATLVAIAPLSMDQVYRSPAIAGVFGAMALAAHLLLGNTWWRRPRQVAVSQVLLGATSLIAASPMLARAVSLIGGSDDASEATWWPWYVAILLGAAVVIGVAGKWQHPNALTAISAISGMVAAGLLLRAAYDLADPDPLLWPPAGIALAVLVGAVAARIRGLRTTMARRWSFWTALLAMAIFLPSIVAAVGRSAAYIGSEVADTTASHLDEPLWWLPMLLAFTALAAASHIAGLRRGIAALAFATALGAVLALALAMRMLTTDLFAWTVAGMVFGVAALLLSLRLDRTNAERAYLATLGRLARDLSLAGVVALAANIAGGLAGTIDAVWNAALYGTFAVLAAAGSVRLRMPAGIYGSTAALVLAFVFLLMAPGVETQDAMLAPVAMSWVLMAISLAPRLGAAWSRPLEHSAWVFGAIPIAFGHAEAGAAWSIDGDIYQRVTLGIMSLALVIGLSALVRREPIRGSASVALFAVAALRQVATYEPESWLPFAITQAVALWALGMLWHRWPMRSNPLYGLAGAVLIGVPFVESFTIGGTTDAFIAVGLAILVVVLGLIVRRQPPVAVGVIGVTLVVLRQLVDTAMAFESWQVMGAAGAVLLIGGTLILMIRDALRRWWDSGRRFWAALG